MNVNQAIEFVENYRGGNVSKLRKAVEVLENSGSPGDRVWAEQGRRALESEQSGLGVPDEGDTTLGETTTEPSGRFERPGGDAAFAAQQDAGKTAQFLEENGIESTGDPETDAILKQELERSGFGSGDAIGGYFPEDNVSDGPRPVAHPGGVSLDGSNQRSEPYREGEEVSILRGLPEEKLRRLQDALVALGLAPEIIPGELDDATVAGFLRLLTIANRNGEAWETSLTRLERKMEKGEIDGVEEQERPGFVEPTRLAPNPDRIRDDIEKFGRDKLGRDLSEEEVEHLAGTLESMELADYERRVEAERGEFEAGEEAATSGEDQPAPEADEFGAQVVASEFGQHFDERYAPEIDRQGRVEIGQAVGELVRGGTGNVGRMTGGV